MAALRALAISLLVALATPAFASAQEAGVDRTAAARALFEQGIELAEAGEWEDAADRFQRALSLRSSPQITYNLANALVQLGRFVRASELLRQVSLDPTVEPEVREAAAARRAEVAPQIAQLTVRVDPSVGAGTVMLDERPIDAAAIGVPVPVDPGAHRLSVMRGTTPLLHRDVDILPGGSLDVLLVEGESGVLSAEDAAAAAATTTTEPDDGGEDVTSTWWFWTTIVGAVLLVGAGVTIGVVFATEPPQGDPVLGNGTPPVIYIGGN